MVLCLQSHHVAEALEDRGIQEVVDRNLAIEALKKELGTLEKEKTALATEVAGFDAVWADLEKLRAQVVSLGKDVDGAKATEELATSRALKANETAENIWMEVEAERNSGVALKAQVDMLNKRLDDAQIVGLATAELYANTLGRYGGTTPSLVAESSVFSIFTWMKTNFAQLSDFIGGIFYFRALASATNFSKMLLEEGCFHIENLKKKDLAGVFALGETSRAVKRSVLNFMKSFWVKFCRAEARSMAEARCTEVGSCPFVLCLDCFSFSFAFILGTVILMSIVIFQELQKAEAARAAAKAPDSTTGKASTSKTPGDAAATPLTWRCSF